MFVDCLQASAAENAEPVEGQGSPGFLSRIISEIAAPLYEEEEEDFLSEDNNRKPDIRVSVHVCKLFFITLCRVLS